MLIEAGLGRGDFLDLIRLANTVSEDLVGILAYSNEPWCGARWLPGPVLLVVLIFGNEVAHGDDTSEIDHGVENNVAEDAGNETIGDRITEWHEEECDKSWYSVADVAPVDQCNLTHHHASDL